MKTLALILSLTFLVSCHESDQEKAERAAQAKADLVSLANRELVESGVKALKDNKEDKIILACDLTADNMDLVLNKAEKFHEKGSRFLAEYNGADVNIINKNELAAQLAGTEVLIKKIESFKEEQQKQEQTLENNLSVLTEKLEKTETELALFNINYIEEDGELILLTGSDLLLAELLDLEQSDADNREELREYKLSELNNLKNLLADQLSTLKSKNDELFKQLADSREYIKEADADRALKALTKVMLIENEIDGLNLVDSENE